MIHLKNTVCTGLGILALTAATFTGAPVANAQNTTGQTQSSAQDISDAKLQAYIVSASKIHKIQTEAAPKLNNAESQQQADSIRKQAEGQMISAIQNTQNITVDEFQMIAQQLRDNEQLVQRVNDLAKSMMN